MYPYYLSKLACAVLCFFPTTFLEIAVYIYVETNLILQESLSADISTPTPTPVSPVVVGTPKTASEWLKQVQQKSPQKSEEEQSPEGRGVSMNCDSAKKKKKFIR